MKMFLSSKAPDWEGRLCYKPPKRDLLQPVFKERYFKLIGNFLFCLRVGTDNKGDNSDPVMMIVMEHFIIDKDPSSDLHSFFVTFKGDENNNVDRRHCFVADSSRTVTQWIEALRDCSYEYKREQLVLLQIKLRDKTGLDPLRATAFQHNPVYSLANNKITCDLSYVQGSPVPPKRTVKLRKNSANSHSNFTSHIGIQSWERSDQPSTSKNQRGVTRKPSFQSHLPPLRDYDVSGDPSSDANMMGATEPSLITF